MAASIHPVKRTVSILSPRGRRSVFAAFVLTVLAAGPMAAQDVEGLTGAVDYYHANATSDLPRMLEATHRFVVLDARYEGFDDLPDLWLASYWAALGYSQLVLFSGDERGVPYVRLAEHYLQKAEALWGGDDPTIQADFHALDALIHGFKAQTFPAEAARHNAERRRLWQLAERVDPDNPMVFMNRAISMIQNPRTRDRAYEHVDRAIELYAPRMGTTRPNWGREFLDVWTGRHPRGEDLLARPWTEWRVVLDRAGGGDAPSFELRDGRLHVHTGAAGIAYVPTLTATDEYRVEMTVTQFDPGGRREGYGLVTGGTRLDSTDRQYDYFLVRRDGQALVKRRAGPRAPVLMDWTAVPAFRRWEGRAPGTTSITNDLVLIIGADTVSWRVNGEEVYQAPRSRLRTDGHVGLRVNHGLELRIDRFRIVGNRRSGPARCLSTEASPRSFASPSARCRFPHLHRKAGSANT